MPVVEALMHRLPVIASNLPAFKEFAGDVPEYVCPLDCSRWQELIIEYAKPDCLSRELQLHKLSAYKIPSWNTHFDQVEALMEQLGASCA
jgi:glycosyltransferase involved in cell wall biosynthesis